MNGPALEVRGLSKSYGPRGLTFTVPRGVISGLLGPNGSGKTTTLRILMGMAHADGGTAHVLGVPAGSSHEIFTRVAFVPEVKDLYPFARAGEMIRLTRGFFPNWDHELEKRLVDAFAIPLRTTCPKLSKGTKAKLALLLAVCRRVELLVLDEPTEGLDPLAIEETLRLLVEQAGRGVTVFFATHQLSEVEQIADHVCIIDRGRAVVAGALDDLKSQYQRLHVVFAEVPPHSVPWVDGVERVRHDGRMLSIFASRNVDAVVDQVRSLPGASVERFPVTLKEIFLECVRSH